MWPYLCFQNTEHYSSYPVYHSVYETFEIVDRFYDPTFKRLCAVAQVRGGLVFLLADSQVLPLDVNQYADSLRKYALSISQLAQRHPEEMNMFKVSFGEHALFFYVLQTSWSVWPHFCILYWRSGQRWMDFILFYLCRCLAFCCGEFHHGI